MIEYQPIAKTADLPPLLCPWHGNTFDVATGSCLANPEEKVQTYPVQVRGEEIWVGMEHEP